MWNVVHPDRIERPTLSMSPRCSSAELRTRYTAGMARIQMNDLRAGSNVGEFDLTFDPREGGEVRLAVDEVDTSRAYHFSTYPEHENYFEWKNVRGRIEGLAIVFELPGIQPH